MKKIHKNKPETIDNNITICDNTGGFVFIGSLCYSIEESFKKCNCSGRLIFLTQKLVKKHRRFLRWEYSCKKLLTRELDSAFCSYIPAVLNSYLVLYFHYRHMSITLFVHDAVVLIHCSFELPVASFSHRFPQPDRRRHSFLQHPAEFGQSS